MHPNDVLLGAQAGAVFLPVCDHYAGIPARWNKALALQRQSIERLGLCPFDVTLDCEDGAPAGDEVAHANAVLAGVQTHFSAIELVAFSVYPRIGVRVHAVDHAAFETDVRIIVGGAAQQLTHVMLPKVERLHDIERAIAVIDAHGGAALPVHALIESPLAVHNAFEIAAHPRVASLSFGLMDFVSAHAGAIDAHGMSAQGQFTHPLVVRAKLEIAAASHAHGKVPSHCVVTEFADTAAIAQAASRAKGMGYSRMWSIHPAQIEPILAAFAPSAAQITQAAEILLAAEVAHWAPIRHADTLHDRASYRFYWQLLQRARASGQAWPAACMKWA
jgi:citrate lyase subunit beta / citryl-CoA lyase